MRIVIIFLCSFLLAACATTNPSAQTNWVGKNVSSLVASYGQPNVKNVTVNGSASYIYTSKIYRENAVPSNRVVTMVAGRKGQTVGVAGPAYNLNPSPALVLCLTTYIVNPQGIITAVRKRGRDC